MGDLDKTATKFFDKAKSDGPPSPSGWQKLYEMLVAPASNAEASQPIPQANPPPTSDTVTDPYANFASKATGQPYK